jgi:hypothetical protein
MVLREIGEDHGAQSGLTTNGNNFVLKYSSLNPKPDIKPFISLLALTNFTT